MAVAYPAWSSPIRLGHRPVWQWPLPIPLGRRLSRLVVAYHAWPSSCLALAVAYPAWSSPILLGRRLSSLAIVLSGNGRRLSYLAIVLSGNGRCLFR